MGRLTAKNLVGTPYVPGYAPRCDDPKTCELIVELTNRLAVFEDTMERREVQAGIPKSIMEELREKGVI